MHGLHSLLLFRNLVHLHFSFNTDTNKINITQILRFCIKIYSSWVKNWWLNNDSISYLFRNKGDKNCFFIFLVIMSRDVNNGWNFQGTLIMKSVFYFKVCFHELDIFHAGCTSFLKWCSPLWDTFKLGKWVAKIVNEFSTCYQLARVSLRHRSNLLFLILK